MIANLSTLLADACRQRPDHAAVVDDRQILTYRQLDERARRVAVTLLRCGVRPGDRVGLLLPKSAEAVCGIYGILYAGAAYVPLDVALPPPRLAYLVSNCGMRVLLTTTRLAETLAPPVEQLLLLGPDSEFAVAEGFTASRGGETMNPSAADDVAYILYTSGSTGQPKGVMISHRNALAFIEWAHQAIGVGPDDRLSSHAPFHFDLSIFDLYVACLACATVVLATGGVVLFPTRLAEWIEQQRISVWYSVPSALVQLWQAGRAERFAYSSLRKVLFAGEVFAPKYLRAWMEKLPQAEFFNLYGPTETNVCAYYPVKQPPAGDTPVPIGRSASEAVLRLLGDDGRAIHEPGQVGELLVEGPTVALGYWGDEVKTHERFLHDPSLTAGRLYRTGDLACWDETGNLLFRGRRDHMIKSRGYRIELGEVEAALSGHPDLEEVVAVAVPHAEWGTAIIACVTARKGASPTEPAIKTWLTERLPRYMIPMRVEIRPALPHTSTGKIDRQRVQTELNS
jgi:amino acid adenylation domain-containing protein